MESLSSPDTHKSPPVDRRRSSHVSSGGVNTTTPRTSFSSRRNTLTSDDEAVPPSLSLHTRSLSSQFDPGPLPRNARLRRSSTLSTFSFSDANREFQEHILDPGADLGCEPSSWWSRVPIMCALLPPVVGVIFQGGSSYVSDLFMIGLSGIFLHWSVTMPW